MEQPLSVKNNGQIKIILNKQSRNIVKELPTTIVPKDLTAEHHILQQIEEQLNSLVGLTNIKQQLKEIYAWVYINKIREKHGLIAQSQALHMMFKGNPGTGKTTVARLIGDLFLKMEVLTKGHLIEVDRADLVGEYIGQTAQKTRELIKKAQGGILFIDEAYSLGRGGEKDFGKEAIDTLVKHMEDKRHQFVLILAGYSNEMEYFLKLNPGLRSRFPIIMDFSDYTVDQLLMIGEKMLLEKEYFLSKAATEKLRNHLIAVKAIYSGARFSNGRYIRNLIERAIRTQSMRLLIEANYEREQLMMIKSVDLLVKNNEV